MTKKRIDMLVKMAISGDQDAYEELVRRYQPGLFKMIYQMIKNREETEDLVQETFIKAFKSLESYNNKYAFSTWLYKIAYNHSIDAIRKKKLRVFSIDRPIKVKDGDVMPQICDDSSSPERELMYREKKKIIHNYISLLPERYRRVIVLRHQEEYSYEEISKMLNIPIGTVKARIFRAREIIKKRLKEDGSSTDKLTGEFENR